MDASTISGSTFTLTKQGSTQPVGAQVSYDAASKKAYARPPQTTSSRSTTYTATIKGGAGGVKDLAGNPLGRTRAWSFGTAASPPH